MRQLLFGKTRKVVNILREKYPGTWTYNKRGHVWQKDDGGYAHYVTILGGYNGDDYAGSVLYYYPNEGTPERVF